MEFYKKATYENYVNKNLIIKIFEIVKEYIRDNNLVVYGGLAIDYILRLKGDKIYDDNIIPDLDVYSPRNIDDALKLSNILNNYFEKTTKFRVVRKKNILTFGVTVRKLSLFVIDISYYPQNDFDNIQFLLYDNLRIYHPNYLRMDIHYSFSTPLNNAPFENIHHRFEKDYERFSLIDKYYPLLKETDKITTYENYPSITKKYNLLDLRSCFPKDSEVSFHGLPSLVAFVKNYNIISKSSSTEFDIQITDNEMILTFPQFLEPICEFIVLSQNKPIRESRLEKYAEYKTIKPKEYIIRVNENFNASVYFTFFDRITIFIYENTEFTSPQYLLLYFIMKYNRTGDKTFAKLYCLVLDMIRSGGNILSNFGEKAHLGPFCLTTKSYGSILTQKLPDWLLTLECNIGASDAPNGRKNKLEKLPNKKYMSLSSGFDYESKFYLIDGRRLKTYN